MREKPVHGGSQRIGDQDFLAQAKDETLEPDVNVVQPRMPPHQFRRDGLVAHDGPGDQVREHGEVRPKHHEISLRRDFPPVNVRKIRERLECVEGDADGKGDSRKMQRPPGRLRKDIQQERGIFENGEGSQIHHGTEEQKGFAGFCARYQPGGQGPVEQNGPDHQQHVPGFTPGVEDE